MSKPNEPKDTNIIARPSQYYRKPNAVERAAAWEKLIWKLSFVKSTNGNISSILADMEFWVEAHRHKPGQKPDPQLINKAFWEKIAKITSERVDVDPSLLISKEDMRVYNNVKEFSKAGVAKKERTAEEIEHIKLHGSLNVSAGRVAKVEAQNNNSQINTPGPKKQFHTVEEAKEAEKLNDPNTPFEDE